MPRWSQGEHVHPKARETAQELERRGYVQAYPDELDDREGVIVVAGHDGSHAPARYYRHTQPDEKGLRRRHEFESWPESAHAERIAYDDTKDGDTHRLGIFRLTAPEHMNDIAALYDGRIRRHREESAASA